MTAALLLEVLMRRRKTTTIKATAKTNLTYARDETRPPRLNFFPFNTRAGTIGTDDCKGADGKGDDVVA